jgi:peptide/nickel transport system permease protein
MPGDPLSIYIDAGLPAETQEAILRSFGLDKPLIIQYLSYLRNFITGDFGMSFHYRQPVLDIILDKFWPTFFLMGASLIISEFLGILLGALFARSRGKIVESIGVIASLALRAAPIFWTGVLAIGIFGLRLGWFPLGGMRAIGQDLPTWSSMYLSVEFLHHLILPVIVSVAFRFGSTMLLMRGSLLETLEEDYIELARAKGLSESIILFRHGLRNALLPVVTKIAVTIGFAMGGQVMLETVFRWPGMGREIVRAISRNDYPLAQAAFFFMSVLIVTMNFLTDLIYGYLDPRVSHHN